MGQAAVSGPKWCDEFMQQLSSITHRLCKQSLWQQGQRGEEQNIAQCTSSLEHTLGNPLSEAEILPSCTDYCKQQTSLSYHENQSTSPQHSLVKYLTSLCGVRVRGTVHLQSPPKNPRLAPYQRGTPQVLPLCQSHGEHDPHTGFYEQTLQWWYWPAEDILRRYQVKGKQKVSVSLCVAHTIQCCLPFVYLLLLFPTLWRNNPLKSTTQGF